ncbi:hypothetical protein [Egicoccus sp. AB-alg2]|uniref:hypothetical protein n=1 Tax=Egicoccus sp. AB-alg2 TaxID=3242693 RepID=UPI00359D3832
MQLQRLFVTVAAAALVTACSGGPEPADEAADAPPPRGDDTAEEEQDPTAPGEDCEQAFADAAENPDEGALNAAITACQDIASFTAAAQEQPEALQGEEPQVWLAEACDDATDPAISESALCQEVAGEAN